MDRPIDKGYDINTGILQMNCNNIHCEEIFVR